MTKQNKHTKAIKQQQQKAFELMRFFVVGENEISARGSAALLCTAMSNLKIKAGKILHLFVLRSLYVWASMSLYVQHVCRSPRVQQRALDVLDLKLQAVVGAVMDLQRIKLRSSAKAETLLPSLFSL